MNRKARIDRKIQVLTEQSNVARFRLRLAQQAVASTDLHPDLRGLAELELTAARDAATTLDRDIAITHMTRNIYPHMMEGSIILVVSADGATAECWEKIDPSQHSGPARRLVDPPVGPGQDPGTVPHDHPARVPRRR